MALRAEHRAVSVVFPGTLVKGEFDHAMTHAQHHAQGRHVLEVMQQAAVSAAGLPVSAGQAGCLLCLGSRS